jgi:hypothetical protein
MGSAPSVQLSHRFERRIVKRLTYPIKLTGTLRPTDNGKLENAH